MVESDQIPFSNLIGKTMRLRFHCEQQVEIPQVAAASSVDELGYVAGCRCAMCVEHEKKLAAKKVAVQPIEPPKELPKNFETHGMVVLESSPQFRTIFSNSNKGLMRLAFPYVIHVVSYKIINEKYIFPGIYGSGLRVFFRNSVMENYSDSVAPAATDYLRYGVVCTPHGYDNRAFNDLHEMCNWAVSTWWNMTHQLQFAAVDWPKMSLEESVKYNWGEEKTLVSFSQALVNTTEFSGYGKNKSFFPPTDSFLIDEPWQTTKQLVLKD